MEKKVLVVFQQQIVRRHGGPAEPGLWRLSRLWHFSAAPADSAALPSIGVCVTHAPYHERSSTHPANPRSAHAPSPSLRTHALIPSHPGSADAPAAGTPRLSARSTTPTSRGCRLTLTHRRLRPIVLFLSVGPVYLTYLINKDKLRRPSCASLLSH